MQAAYLLTIRSTANLVLQLVLLPAISRFCVVRLHIDPLSKDLWIARVSGITITIGALMIAFSSTPWLLCIGKRFKRVAENMKLTEMQHLLSSRLAADSLQCSEVYSMLSWSLITKP